MIRELREEAGLTRNALAKAACLDPAALMRIEDGDLKDPRFSTVCQIAVALGLPVDAIAARVGLMKIPARRLDGSS